MRVSAATFFLFCATLFAVAVLYSCVGQAGASGYIAAMALFGFAPAVIKPTALVLNVFVAALVSVRFYRAGHFNWRLAVPLLLSSFPAALLGGFLTLPPSIFNRLLGSLLLLAAIPLLVRPRAREEPILTPPSLPAAVFAGASIGLISGLTGVGGGVIISPLLLYGRWAGARMAAAVSAVFILINSLSALVGNIAATRFLPADLPIFALAAVLGGAVGSGLGSVHLPARSIYRILTAILLFAGIKLAFFSS